MLLPPILVANVGVPMLALLWPAYWLAWLPLTVLQAELAHRDLGLPRATALKSAGIAKLVSVMLGVPLAWAGMFALQLGVGAVLTAAKAANPGALAYATLPLRLAWLPPTENAWRVYLAFALLAVPCCLLALAAEFRIARRMLASCDPRAVRAWIKRANLLSYLLMVLAAAIYPLASGGKAW